MYVDVDFSKIKSIETDGPEDGIYTISIVFINEQVMTYAYTDKHEYAKDYLELVTDTRRTDDVKC